MNLKHTPCDCAEWRRLNEACADLMRERDYYRDALAKDAARYRHLRDNYESACNFIGFELDEIAITDAAVDAAMQENPHA